MDIKSDFKDQEKILKLKLNLYSKVSIVSGQALAKRSTKNPIRWKNRA